MQHRTLFRALLLVVPILLTVLVAVPLSMRVSVLEHSYIDPAAVPRTHVALVLGASVVRGKLSPVLEERAAAALELYRAGKVSKILVTGDSSTRSNDEVAPVRAYLVEAGIPARDIFLDHAGFDTYSSMYRARKVYLASSVTIATQDFHLPRALYIARHLGLNAEGLSLAGTETPTRYYFREIAASFKALIDLGLERQAKYLGSITTLEGDGTVTWKDGE